MHPQIRQTKPGKCPICFMDLIPLKTNEIAENRIEFSEAAMKLMELQTSPVERKFVTAEIRLSGKIDYDETRVKYITSWISGRIDKLYVDYTGIKVNQGDHMVYIYSPELISAQAELLQATKAIDNIKPDGSELISRSVLATRDAATEKLRLLGLKDEQIEEIETTGKPVDHLTIYAPIGGVVIEKNVTEGMYVETGTKIYTIADLSQLWVRLDAYESDMMWIRYGQEVEFTTEAYPGEIFKGRISFIDPVPVTTIPETINRYDIGLYFLNPSGFNNTMALPNKLFEFIQGRLAVAIWPSPEMARIVKKYQCGVVSDEFSIPSMAKILNNLSAEDIVKFKESSHKAAPYLCAEKNKETVLSIMRNLIG